MQNVTRFWLKRGIAGFRIDAINFLFEANKNDFKGKYPNEPVSGLADNTPENYEYLDHVYILLQGKRQLVDEFNKTDSTGSFVHILFLIILFKRIGHDVKTLFFKKHSKL